MPPRSKSKAKAKAPGAIEPEAAVRMHTALQDGILDASDLASVLRADAPGCAPADANGKPSSCKGRKDNPNCLCGLVPIPGSYRKKGLWQKHPDVVTKLGEDPSLQRRLTDEGVPCGLNNLGNTCYVNAALQCLFASHAFRRGVYALEGVPDPDGVISEIRRLFAELQAGPRASADPTQFAKTLKLDHTVQQDGQEFMKLLLSLLEQRFALCPNQEVQRLVPELFRGQCAYEMTCQACGQKSASSRRLTDFYELDLEIKKFAGLEHSLTHLLAPELLCGDNQFFCDTCGHKVDATRQTRLRALPPYLCLSLKRFVFDMKTLTKVKVSDKYNFPLSLDFGGFLSAEAAGDEPAAMPPSEYELVAILIHKGGSASHGHYVAHVKSEETGDWWRFDDSEVTKMERGPAGEHSDHGVAAEKKPKPESKAKPNKESSPDKDASASASEGDKQNIIPDLNLPVDANGNAAVAVDLTADDADDALAQAGAKAAAGSRKQRKRRPAAAAAPARKGKAARSGDSDAASASKAAPAANGSVPAALPSAAVNGTAAHAAGDGSSSGPADSITSANAYLLVYRWHGDTPSHNAPAMPDSLREAMESEQLSFDGACVAFEGAKEDALSAVSARRDGIQEVLHSASVGDATADARWIATAWLTSWADSPDLPPPIDNAPLLCEHGKLDPTKVSEGKRISTAAWEALKEAHRGGPELATTDACTICLEAMLRGIADAQEAGQARANVLEMLTQLEAPDAQPITSGYYVSATWLSGWKKRSGRSMSEVSPTAGIACPHGGLLPEATGAKARRAAVPEAAWRHFKGAWAEAEAARAEAATKAAAKRAEGDDECIILDSPPRQPVQNSEQPASADTAAGAAAMDVCAATSQQQPSPLLEFRISVATECELCSSGLQSDMQQHQGVRSEAVTQRQALGNLAAGTQPQLEPGGSYILLPAAWLALWRAYLAAASKRGAAAAAQKPQPPPPLSEAMASCFCRCHAGSQRMLAFRPPQLANRRGKWQVAAGDSDFFELATSQDWESLQAFSGGGNGNGDAAAAAAANGSVVLGPITAQLVVESPTAPAADGDAEASAAAEAAAVAVEADAQLAGARSDEVIIGDDLQAIRRPAGGRAATASATASLRTQPPVCEATVAAAEAAAKAARLTYTGAEIMVSVVTEAEATAPDTAAIPAAGERKSRRARRGRAPLKLSSSDDLAKVRLLIFQELGVNPRNAALYAGGKLLEGDTPTLAECEVYPGSELRVVDRGVVDNDDLSFLPGGSNGGGGTTARERGFVGTALAGGAVPQDVLSP